MELVSNSKEGASKKSPHVRRIREYVREIICDAEASIAVTELACLEPECPPIETAIVVMGSRSKTVKIGKAMKDVSFEDVLQVFNNETRHSH